MPKKLTTEDFKRDAKEVHGDKYDYSKVKYINNRTKVKIICNVKDENGKEILFRQIAGAVARRICYYAQVGKAATQGEEFGFIKFGSRIDVFLPLETKIDVKIGDIVKAKTTRLAHF